MPGCSRSIWEEVKIFLHSTMKYFSQLRVNMKVKQYNMSFKSKINFKWIFSLCRKVFFFSFLGN